MKELILDVLVDSLIDTVKTIPFLYLVYLLIEYIEHKHSEKLSGALRKMGPFGAVGGAVLGCVPQCGFSAAASNLFSGGLISAGTLIAVYVATSDEAIPLLIADPSSTSALWKLILIKIIAAVVTGIAVDLALKAFSKSKEEAKPHIDELCKDCDCEHHHIAYSALIHTVQITIFIFIVNLVLGLALGLLGDDTISGIFLQNSVFQPFIAALFGFIPNCASSVVITQLYLDGVLSFGSCVAGLCTGAGVGLPVLFRTNRNVKQNLAIMGVMYLSACVTGLIVGLF